MVEHLSHIFEATNSHISFRLSTAKEHCLRPSSR